MTTEPARGWQLVYDGDCGFCNWCVDYARVVTRNERGADSRSITYRAYQDAAADHPDVPLDRFRASIQLFTPDGRFEGAKATFMVLAVVPRLAGWHWLYRYLPGFAALTELAYRCVARHRDLVFRLARSVVGRELLPLGYTRTAGVIVRGVGWCALVAFVSFGWQANALIGTEGILPVGDYFAALSSALGPSGVLEAPAFYWLHASDETTWALVGAGAAASLALIARRFVVPAALVAYAAYLSLFYAGRVFMAFQWDLLLVEALFAVAVLGWRERTGIWVLRLLAFRFMLMSGAVKLLSGDPTWSGLTALDFHFQTQPLPTVVAWYAHALPASVHAAGTFLTLAIELVLPIFVFAPRRLRCFAATMFLLLELVILVTGNYNFFNVLTMLVCVALLDDRRLRGARFPGAEREFRRTPPRVALGGFVLLTALQLHVVFGRVSSAEAIALSALEPWQIVNRYGLFAVMTQERRELVIEWSRDGATWNEVELPFKPGALEAMPRWAAPYQPRLDWQMWFAALGPPEASPWMEPLLARLLLGSDNVRRLFAEPPPSDATELRVRSYRYRFTTAEERAATGNWWQRSDATEWLPPLRLVRSPP